MSASSLPYVLVGGFPKDFVPALAKVLATCYDPPKAICKEESTMEASVAEAPTEKRAKSTPMWRVFREDEETGDWELLTQDALPASGKRQAIRAATGSDGGRCFAIKDKEFDPKTRGVTEIPQPPKVEETWV